MLKNSELRAILDVKSSKHFLWHLAGTFPSIQGKLWGIDFERWAPIDLRTMVFGSSHGERCALQFLLRVWNASTDWDDPRIIEAWSEHLTERPAVPFEFDPTIATHAHAYRVGKFDVFEALGVWDDEHRAAFLEWAKDPIWP